MGNEIRWQSLAMAADAQAVLALSETLDDLDETGEDAHHTPTLRGDTAERLLRRFLTLCESPRTSARMLSMVKGALEHEGSGRRFYSIFNAVVLSPVMRLGGLKSNAVRGELVASQLIGLAMMRYVIKVEPICSLDREDVVALMAPAIRAALSSE